LPLICRPPCSFAVQEIAFASHYYPVPSIRKTSKCIERNAEQTELIVADLKSFSFFALILREISLVTPHIKSVFRNVPASNSDRGDGRLAPAAGSVSELKALGNQGDDRRRSLPAILIGSRSGVNQPSFSCVVRVIIQHEHPADVAAETATYPRDFEEQTVNPIDERLLGA